MKLLDKARSKKRIFVAINLPKEIKAKLAEVQSKMRDLPVRWADPSNTHLTLWFCGWVEEGDIKNIEDKITEEIENVTPFEMEIGELGAFPDVEHPHIIWVGAKVPDSIEDLFRKLNQWGKKKGFNCDERKFSPHLTLGRLKERIRDFEGIICSLGKVEIGRFKADQIDVMESLLSKNGVKYKKLRGIKL